MGYGDIVTESDLLCSCWADGLFQVNGPNVHYVTAYVSSHRRCVFLLWSGGIFWEGENLSTNSVHHFVNKLLRKIYVSMLTVQTYYPYLYYHLIKLGHGWHISLWIWKGEQGGECNALRCDLSNVLRFDGFDINSSERTSKLIAWILWECSEYINSISCLCSQTDGIHFNTAGKENTHSHLQHLTTFSTAMDINIVNDSKEHHK